jgi:hypothetical protein
VLLTRENCELEQALEMQLRELTLLPLNILNMIGRFEIA